MRRAAALILGGGPAGSAAAIALAAAGTRALVIERTREPGDALCGGFLSWRTLEALARCGIDADALNRERIATVRLFARGRSAEARLPRPALAVSRRRLDAMMLARAEALGAAIERGIAIRELDGVTARLDDGATMTGDAVLLATGKHELRGAHRDAPSAADPTLGLRVRLAAAPALDRLIGDAIELHLFDRGYAGLVRQEDGSANLCLAAHRSRLRDAGDPAALLRTIGDECPALGDRLAHATIGPVDAIANVPYGWRTRTAVPGRFRVGDQAAVIPSLAGEGMGIAIASGTAAARALLAGGPDAATAYQAAFARAAARPLAAAGMIRAAAEGPAAPALVALARLAPGLVQIAASLTRIKH